MAGSSAGESREFDPKDDPFAVLGLPRKFDLDEAAIDRAWLRLSARVHPDRPDAPVDAADRLAAINHARDCVKDPEQRASALMRLLGEQPGPGSNVLPDGFLVEMLEIRESLEAARSSGDEQGLGKLEAWARSQREAYARRFSEVFAGWDGAPSAVAMQEARRELNAWRYIERMLEEFDRA